MAPAYLCGVIAHHLGLGSLKIPQRLQILLRDRQLQDW